MSVSTSISESLLEFSGIESADCVSDEAPVGADAETPVEPGFCIWTVVCEIDAGGAAVVTAVMDAVAEVVVAEFLF